MKTKLSSGYEAPDFDAQIADWIDSFEHDEWGGVIRKFGIADPRSKMVYRSIEADGMQEVIALLQFLSSIGLRDLRLNFRSFDSVYGISPEN